MELRHIRYFIAAAEEEHFGRAAERLHITRPAVSQIIADLEAEVGTLLFERLAHNVRLTAAGRILLTQLTRVMADLNEALVLTRRVGQGKTGTLNIGYGSLTLMHSIFRAAVKRFHETYPDVTLSLIEVATTLQPRALAEGKIHAGFMHVAPTLGPAGKRKAEFLSERDGTVLDYINIQTGALGVAVSAEHRFAQRKSIALSELADEKLVVVPKSSSSPSYGQLYTLCQQAGFEPNVVQEVSTVASQLNLISVGMGIGFAVMGKNFVYPHQLSVVPLKDVNYPTSFIFGWVRGQRTPILDRMIEIITALAE
ncbi:LysR substrate-binding domain-containing protein [Caballeronia novacaledonica]|uniref:LysR family transcriptional regulator n=1 Tax=Caballeronia novacaledonica TaxID=1544861 RepID=A0AA37IIU2_9BURK|nr:LysR substrate-binding domain-containing protein [Caballeronia novacaledonica]GJH30064.1 LysR family transcriptional regulator [Caballeronia novacaledonica]